MVTKPTGTACAFSVKATIEYPHRLAYNSAVGIEKDHYQERAGNERWPLLVRSKEPVSNPLKASVPTQAVLNMTETFEPLPFQTVPAENTYQQHPQGM